MVLLPVPLLRDAPLLRPFSFSFYLQIPQFFAPVHRGRRLPTPFALRRVVPAVPVPVYLLVRLLRRRSRLDNLGFPFWPGVVVAVVVTNLTAPFPVELVQGLEAKPLHKRLRQGAMRVGVPPMPLLLLLLALLRLFRLLLPSKFRIPDPSPVNN